MKRNFTIKKAYWHLQTVMIHKQEVFKACHKAGYTFRGLKHDLSKFSPTEFIESVKYKEKGRSPIEIARKEKDFSVAWQHHKGANSHHWEYWTKGLRANNTTPIKIPFDDLVEMFCDWMGAGLAYSRTGGSEWTPQSAMKYWVELRDNKSIIHPETVDILNTWYESLVRVGLDQTLRSLKKYKSHY